ncbi:MAG: hypothetical protein AB7I42_25930 [Bradyrhizobium sp.]|uniref:hypothetical protein n=1 Tax=Bradyrhizobium sp. TaxID=376 RepID=UPI003D0B385F
MLLFVRFLPYILIAAVIAGGWFWVDDMRRDLEAAQARASMLETAQKRAEATSQALNAQLAAVEKANEQRDRDYRGITAALRAGQDSRRAARAADPVLGEWAATVHPAAVADGLRGAPDSDGHGVDRGTATGSGTGPDGDP